MADYLIFQLYGPLASWGEIAVGESRHSAAYPSRSALLGLLGAALGIRREDEAGQAALISGYRFGVKLHAIGHSLRDYHTVQVGPQLKKLRYRTRRQELTLPTSEQLGTLLSSREYRCDSFASVAVAATDQAAYGLDQVGAALKNPVFPLYLGRKSCPPALPLAPKLATFASLKDALDAFDAHPLPELFKEERQANIRERANHLLNSGPARYYWEESFGPGGLVADVLPSMTLVRHDQPTSRSRWQFGPRREHVLMEDKR